MLLSSSFISCAASLSRRRALAPRRTYIILPSTGHNKNWCSEAGFADAADAADVAVAVAIPLPCCCCAAAWEGEDELASVACRAGTSS